MVTVIVGDGAHARDIAATLNGPVYRLHHHRYALGHPGPYLIGINDPWTRAKVAAELGEDDLAWVHPNAFLGPDCEIGAGSHVNYGVTMTRTRIGRHCTISPGVTICGDVTIGDRVLVGAGATICDRVTIEDDVTVGAGAVVLPGRTLKAGGTYLGVPAR